ncbi:hypothetical protein ACIXNO_13030 [Bacteroides fragilis]
MDHNKEKVSIPTEETMKITIYVQKQNKTYVADANHHRDSNVRWTHRIYQDRMWEANLYHSI